MTCIIGLVTEDRIFIGGDGASNGSDDTTPVATEKVYRNGPYLIGSAGSWRAMNILRFTTLPYRPRGVTSSSSW